MPLRYLCLALIGLNLMISGCIPKSTTATSTNQGGESLGQQVARHEMELQRLLSQVGQVEQVLPGQAEMWSQMQTMRQELNTVQGRLEDMEIQVSGDGGGELYVLKDRVGRMESLLRQIASQLAVSTEVLDSGPSSTTPPLNQRPATTYTPAVTPPVTDPGTTVTPPQADSGKDTPTRLYENGVNAFSQRKYNDAIVIFKDFVGAYPGHQLAGNAHFWQGESYFQLKDYARAAIAYQEVIVNFPGSNKMQSSMLKQGISLFHAGKKDAARQRLDELVGKYPNSPEATSAKDFISKNF